MGSIRNVSKSAVCRGLEDWTRILSPVEIASAFIASGIPPDMVSPSRKSEILPDIKPVHQIHFDMLSGDFVATHVGARGRVFNWSSVTTTV